MAVTVHFANADATITAGLWASDDTEWASLLNSLVIASVGYDPDPDFTKAQAAATAFDGVITYHDKPKAVKGRVY